MFSNFLTFSVTDGGRRTERDDDGTAARYYPSRHVPFATLCVAGATMTPSLDGSAKVIEDHDVCLSLECTRKRRSVRQKKQQNESRRRR